MSSMRKTIAQGIVAFLQGVIDPATTLPLYQETKLGHMFDPTPYSAWAEVTFLKGKSGPAGAGGYTIGWRIEDKPIYKITSGWRYDTDSTAASLAMLDAMDILLPTLHSHFTIPSPSNPSQAIASVYSLLEDGEDHAVPVKFPNGYTYLLWETFVTAKQQYSVTLVTP